MKKTPGDIIILLQKTKKKKTKQTPGDIIILQLYTKAYDHTIYSSWDMVHGRQLDRWTNGWMDRQTNRWKKWHIEVGVPHKNEKK